MVNIPTCVYLLMCFVLGDGLTGTPLTTSARISALNIVGELLRKVGVRHLKMIPLQCSVECMFTELHLNWVITE